MVALTLDFDGDVVGDEADGRQQRSDAQGDDDDERGRRREAQ